MGVGVGVGVEPGAPERAGRGVELGASVDKGNLPPRSLLGWNVQ